MADTHNMGMAHKTSQSGVGTSLSEYARELEGQLDVGGREALRRLRESFTLGAELIELRRERGLTQAQLADEAGVNQSEISRLEHGAANPSMATLEAIAAVLGVRLGFVTTAR